MEELIRKCPNCDKNIQYKRKGSFIAAVKHKGVCRSCATTNKNKKRWERGDFNINPFQGKTHTNQTKEKIKTSLDIYNKEHDNPMKGRSVYSIWLEKFGEEIAIEKHENFKKSVSNGMKGENNPMYGKPSPQGSGNGWSGWYKQFFFRSLLELSFLVQFSDKNIISCENQQFKIQYIGYDNLIHNYYPDYLIDGTIYEIKPQNLWNSDSVKRKVEAAFRWCNKNNYSFKLLEPKKIENELFLKLIESNEVILTERYKKKLEQYVEKR